MNGTHDRLAVLLALSALALAACGGGSVESPMDPGLSGDAAVFSTLGNGNGAPETPAGDGVCDGCDGTCDGTGPHGPGNGTGDGTCDGTGPHGPNGPYGPGDGTCDGSGPGDGTCDVTSPEGLQAILVEALQEEYMAEWTYRRVLADFGDVAPFSVIADSEARHVEAIRGLFARRDWTAPASTWNIDNVAAFDTLAEACAGGVAVEIEDGALYERFLAWDELPQDAVNVFTNLQAVSLNNHLPAFQRCQ
jgi:hypothetical protein